MDFQGEATKVDWSWGDGTMDEYNQWNSEHLYANPGTYIITCTFWDMNNSMLTIEKEVFVSNDVLPNVQFEVQSYGSSCSGDPIMFNVHQDYQSLEWNFGDETPHVFDLRNPAHAYPVNGEYTVSLVASNLCGNFDTASQIVYIEDSVPAYANFWIENNDPCPFDLVKFEAENSGTFYWDFGDGETGFDPIVRHAYKDTGIYEVTLINQNGCGDVDSAKQIINVMYHPERGSYGDTYVAIKLDEYGGGVAYTEVCPGTLVAFENHSFIPEGSRYYWDFGDGSPFSKEFEPVHVYHDAGFYNPRFIVTNNCGFMDEFMLSIDVNDSLMPFAMMMSAPQAICPGEDVLFWDEEFERANNYSYSFEFGDGSSLGPIQDLTKEEPRVLAKHPYDELGEYMAVVTVSNTCGNSITDSLYINVSPDTSRVPFYYIDNTASGNDDGPEDWSRPHAETDHVFTVPVNWTQFPTGQNENFYVFFWYGGVYPASPDMPDPDGMVKIIGNGGTAIAYVPMSEMAQTIGIAATWSCTGEANGDPSAFGLPLDGSMLEINEFDIIPYASTVLEPVDLGAWDGNCFPSYNDLDGTFETADLGGYNFVIHFMQWDGKYEIGKRYPDGKFDLIERGWYSAFDSLVSFEPDYDDLLNTCPNSHQYNSSMLNGELKFFDSGDNCINRSEALITGIFHKMIEDFDKDGACPGDVVFFQAIGGIDYEWDFTTHTDNGSIVSNVFDAVGEYTVNLYATNACGRTDSLYSYVTIADNIMPPAWFKTSTDYAFVEQSVEFMAENDRPGAEEYDYIWHFGDGTTGVGQFTEHVYEFPGEYHITLDVTNGCGTASESRNIHVMERPGCKAQFDYVYDPIMDSVYFINSSLGDLTDGVWQFGDGTQSSELSPSHQYSEAGVYNVCLTVRDTINNCIDTYCKDVFIGQVNCYADFIFFVNNETNEVSFNDASMGNIRNWSWDFGDGFLSDVQNPKHTYAPGLYTVCLSIFDVASGCQDYRCFDISVGELNCFPEFTSYVDNLTVEFQTQSTGATEHYWDFGDGYFSEERNPIHTYEYPGYYGVYYSIYNDSTECYGEMFRDIEVFDSTSTYVSCKAEFSHFLQADSNKVSLFNESFGSFTDVYWNFGDNSYSSEVNPIKYYDYPGIYEVCLSIYDSLSECQDDICMDIIVEATAAPCNADFSFVRDILPGQFKFRNQSMGEITNYEWRFGDNTHSNLENPVHQFTKPGYFPVNLSIFDTISGCFDDVVKEVYVKSPDSTVQCKADFSYFIDPSNLKVTLYDKALGNITKWYWTFGDGSYDEIKDPVHQYNFAGEFIITQYVFNENTGCTDQKTEVIKVGSAPCDLTANIDYFVNTETKTVTFEDNSYGDRDIYYWTFGDGQTSDEANPEHTYTNPGFYMVTFSVIDSTTNCSDHTSEFIQIGSTDCKADFEYNVNVDSLEVTFINNSEENHFNYWSFGDGNFSDNTTPVHRYRNPGKYHTALVIGDETGICWDYLEEAVQVGEVNCDASFTVTVNPATLEVRFTNEGQARSTNLYWQFGDGSTSTMPNPNYRYSYPGYYFTSLYTYNQENDCMDNYEEIILVGSEGSDCEADFYYQANTTTLEVQFTDNSRGQGLSYLWDFGDTETSTEANPVHPYVDPGYKYVCLTILNGNGIPNMTCKDVNVGEGCLAQFDFVVDSMSVTFQDNSFGSPSEWSWDLGDGSDIINTQSPTHTYTEVGDYLIDFRIKNASGCTNRTVAIISVGNSSDTTFSANFVYDVDTTGSKPSGYPVDMFGTGKGDAPSAKWAFGDKTKSGHAENATTLRPSYEYTEPGTYEVCLTIEDPITGQTATTCKNIKVGETSSVNTLANYAEMEVYPNPATDFTKLSYTLHQNMDLRIILYNASGQKVKEILNKKHFVGSYAIDIELSTFSSGTYFIEIQSANGKLSKQLILRK